MREVATRRLVNLGCGPRARRTSWEDCDGSWNLRWQRSIPGKLWHGLLRKRKGDIWPAHVKRVELTRRLPFGDDSIDAIYASHVLEHLHHEDATRLLSECGRVLRKGEGVLRLVLPDTRRIARDFLESEDPTAAERFNRALMFRPMRRARGFRRVYDELADFHSHKFMYDEAHLVLLLHASGFREANVRGYLDSRIPEIAEVEDPGRVLDGAGFIVEALL